MLLILTTDLLHSLHSPWRDPQQYIPYSQKVVFCWDHLFIPVTVTVTHNKNFHHCINTAERKYHKFNSKFLTLPYIFTIHFMPLVSFYIPERIKKPVVSFPIFLGGIERDQCNEIGWIELFFYLLWRCPISKFEYSTGYVCSAQWFSKVYFTVLILISEDFLTSFGVARRTGFFMTLNNKAIEGW